MSQRTVFTAAEINDPTVDTPAGALNAHTQFILDYRTLVNLCDNGDSTSTTRIRFVKFFTANDEAIDNLYHDASGYDKLSRSMHDHFDESRIPLMKRPMIPKKLAYTGLSLIGASVYVIGSYLGL